MVTGVGTRPGKTRPDTTVGRILRHARERRGLTLDNVTTEINIPVRHLKALEEGNLSLFSAEVYARGAFIKYADYVGCRAETTQRAFLRQLSGAREYVPLRVHTPQPWLAQLLTPRWVLAAAITCLALLLGTYIAWQLQSFLRLPALAVAEPASDVSPGISLTLRGQTEPATQLHLNEQPVLVDASGMFEIPLTLHPGINVVQLTATNAAGRKRTIERHLLMPRN